MNRYAHGANVASFASSIGASESEIVDFSSNINFVKPDIKTDFGFDILYPYESSGYAPLRSAVQRRYGVSEGCFELFNGASSGIFSLFSFLSPDVVSLYAPIYAEYKKISEMLEAKTVIFNRLDGELKIPTKDSVAVFVNPSTPDGTLYDVSGFLDEWCSVSSAVIIDESFLDFTDGVSALGEVEKYKNLYVVKSMTKYYGAAGVRVGFVASNRQNIELLAAREPLWKLSSFDAWYLSEALKDTTFDTRSKTENTTNKALLGDILHGSGLFDKILPSSANYITARLQNMSAKELQNAISHSKILIRDCANFDGLGDRYVRFAVKKIDDLQRLKAALGVVV